MPILKVKNKITGLWEDIPYIKGEKGEKGDTGERGPQGIQGEQGIQGIQGDQGIPGVQGPIGLTGPQGVQGEKGDKGDTGAVPIFTVGSTTTLPPGSAPSINIDSTDPENPVMEFGIPKGDTGAKGDKGDKGDTGDTGPAPSFTVGTTSSLPAGSAPVITIDSSDPAHLVMDFGIPAGAKGDKGDKGDTGAAGQDGADGADGTDGQDGVSPTVTVTEISGGHNIEITDAQGTTDFDVMDGEVSEEQLETALIDKADVITNTASGEIVTISDGGNDLPVVDLSVSLLPVQSGSGDPSPDNVRPISGWTGVEAYRSQEFHRCIPNDGNISWASNGITVTHLGGGKYRIYGQSTSSDDLIIPIVPFTVPSGTGRLMEFNNDVGDSNCTLHFYNDTGSYYDTWIMDPANRTNNRYDVSAGKNLARIGVSVSNGSTVDMTINPTFIKNKATVSISWQNEAGTIFGGTATINQDGSADLVVKNMTFTLDGTNLGVTTGFGINTSSSYPNLMNCPYATVDASVQNIKNSWLIASNLKYKTYANRYSAEPYTIYQVSSTSGSQLSKLNIALASDSGVSTLEQFNTWLSNNPVQIVFERLNYLTYHFDNVGQLKTFLGTNNFWSNGNGQIDLEYRADTKLYIEQLTKPSEDDMTANQNITSGSFFMVGNRLFLSTVAIAQGSTIIPGTNCTEVSLADALNSLNS